jgi:hypothetical protein
VDDSTPTGVACAITVGKGGDMRRRKEKQHEAKNRTAAKVRAEVSAAYDDAERALKMKRDDPPNSIAPDAPVPAPLKPKPHLRPGAIALPEPHDSDNALSEIRPRRMSK